MCKRCPWKTVNDVPERTIESIYKRNSKTTSNLLFIAHKKKQSAKPIAFCKMIEAYFKKLVVNDSFKFVDALVVGIPRTGMSAV
jgi:hypothetical protein